MDRPAPTPDEGQPKAKKRRKTAKERAAQRAEAATDAAQAALAAQLGSVSVDPEAGAMAAPPPCVLRVEVGAARVHWHLHRGAQQWAGTFASALARDVDGQWRVGEAAVAGSLLRADEVAFGPGRLLGQPATGAAAQAVAERHGSARVVDDGGDAALLVAGQVHRPEAMVALLLAEALRRAGQADATPPDEVTLVVPVAASSATRRALRQAAALAGIVRPRLLHATTLGAAAATPAFCAKVEAGLLCVVDVGAGGAGITVLDVQPPVRAAGSLDATSAREEQEAQNAEGAQAAQQAQNAGEAQAAQQAQNVEGAQNAQQTQDAQLETEQATVAARVADDGPPAGDAPSDPPPAGDEPQEEAPIGDPSDDDGDKVDVAAESHAAASPPAFDVAEVRLQVRAHRAAPHLGSHALDAALVGWLDQQFVQAHPKIAPPTATPLGLGRLWSAAEQARQALDHAPACAIALPHLAADLCGSKHLQATLQQGELDGLVQTRWIEQLVALCRQACRAAGAEPRQLRGWLVQGNGAPPALREALRRLFGRNALSVPAPASASLAPNTSASHAALAGVAWAVADNAAPEPFIAAATLPAIGEATTGALGWTRTAKSNAKADADANANANANEADDPAVTVLLPAGTALPTKVTLRQQTEVDEQDLVRVHLVTTEPDDPEAWRPAGTLVVDDLPARAAGQVVVDVTLAVDEDALLTASATLDGRPLPVRHLQVAGLDSRRMTQLAQQFTAEREARMAKERLQQLRQAAEALLLQTAQLGEASAAEAGVAEAEATSANAQAAAEGTRGTNDGDAAATATATAETTGDGDATAGATTGAVAPARSDGEAASRHAELRQALQQALAQAEDNAREARLSGLADLTPLEGHLQALRAAARSRGGNAAQIGI